MSELTRRGFIAGLSAIIAAPAIVRPGLIMPIKPSLVPVLDPVMVQRFVVDSVTQNARGEFEVKCVGLLCSDQAAYRTVSKASMRSFDESLSNEIIKMRRFGFHPGEYVVGRQRHTFEFTTDKMDLARDMLPGSVIAVDTQFAKPIAPGEHRFGWGASVEEQKTCVGDFMEFGFKSRVRDDGAIAIGSPRLIRPGMRPGLIKGE